MILSPQVNRAIELACLAHRDQFRKGGQSDVPYVSHPFAVATMVASLSTSEDAFVAALLHDVIEDCPNYLVGNVEHFTDEAFRIVTVVTDKKTPGLSYRDRKAQFVRQVIAGGARCVLVSACDKIHNMTCVRDNLRGGFPTGTRPLPELVWYWTHFLEQVRLNMSPNTWETQYAELLAELDKTCPTHGLYHSGDWCPICGYGKDSE